jgi:hypothetical protein
VRLVRKYWLYSAGLAVVWCVVIALSLGLGGEERLHKILPVFLGFLLGWLSTTIARYVYPPPARWLR